MYKMLLAAAAIAGASVASAAGVSQTYIPPGDAFLLGGGQSAPATIAIRNIGPVAVVAAVRNSGGDRVLRRVEPGVSFSHSYAPGEIAVYRNSSSERQATIRITLTDAMEGMGMRYQLPQD